MRDSSIWFALLRASFFSDSKHTAALVYEQLLPFLNQRPILSNHPAPPDDSVPAIWYTPTAAADPYGHDLATIAAVVALQLGAATNNMGVPSAPGGAQWPPGQFGMPPGATPPGQGPAGGCSSDGISLMLRHQLSVMAHQDLLRAQAAEPGSVTPGVLEMLSRAAGHLSACTNWLHAGAITLAIPDLEAMQGEIAQLMGAVTNAKANSTSQQSPVQPPAENGMVRRRSPSYPLTL